MKVYGFFYNSSCCESAAALQDLYTTKESAERAMNVHKEFAREKGRTRNAWYDKEGIPESMRYPFDFDQDWFVDEIEIKD